MSYNERITQMNKIDHLVNVLVSECEKQKLSVLVSVIVDDEVTVNGFGSQTSLTESVNVIHGVVVEEFSKEETIHGSEN